MRKTSLCMAALLGLTLFLFIQSVQAINLDFVPANQTVVVGNPVNVDVVISGLNAANEIVSAYDLDVTYDNAVLTATKVSFGFLLGDPSFFEVLESFDISSPGIVDFAALSLLSDADLDALQGDSVTLATLSFDSLSVGTSPLNFVLDQFNDVKGKNNEILSLEVGDGNISVAPIPEPSTILLLGSGLAGLVGMRWVRKRTK